MGPRPVQDDAAERGFSGAGPGRRPAARQAAGEGRRRNAPPPARVAVRYSARVAAAGDDAPARPLPVILARRPRPASSTCRAQTLTTSPPNLLLAPGAGSNARMRSMRVAAGRAQSIAASDLAIFCRVVTPSAGWARAPAAWQRTVSARRRQARADLGRSCSCHQFVRADASAAREEHVPGVEPRVHLYDRDPGLARRPPRWRWIGAAPAPARRQRGVDVQAAQRGGSKQAPSRQDRSVGGKRRRRRAAPPARRGRPGASSAWLSVQAQARGCATGARVGCAAKAGLSGDACSFMPRSCPAIGLRPHQP